MPCQPAKGLSTWPLQGTFVKRHKIQDPAGNPLKPEAFAVGSSVTVYTRTLHIVDADDFTRRHMEGLGISLLPAQPYPADPVEGYRAAFARKTAGAGSRHLCVPAFAMCPLYKGGYAEDFDDIDVSLGGSTVDF